MRTRRTRCAAWLLTFLLPTTVACGDDTPAGKQGIDVPHLTADHALVLVFQPKRSLNSKFAKAVPTGALENTVKESGIDTKELERMVWAFKAPTAEQIKAARDGDPDGPKPEAPSFHFEFAETPERQPILDVTEADEAKRHAGQEYFVSETWHTVAFPTDKSIVIAPEDEVKRVLGAGNAAGKGALADRLRTSSREFDMLIVCDLAGREELVKFLVEQAKESAPPQMAPQLELAEKVKSLVLVADLDGDTLVKADVEARDGDVDEVKARLDGVVQLARTLYQFSARPELQRSPLPFKEQALAVADDLVAKLAVSSEGNTVTFTVARPKGMDDLLKAAKPLLDQFGGAGEDAAEE